MAAFNTYNKKHGIKNVVYEIRYFNYVELHGSSHLTRTERKNENSQNTEKISTGTYFLSRRPFY